MIGLDACSGTSVLTASLMHFLLSGTVTIQSKLSEDRLSREIGNLAVWTVTSAKAGNGVDLLRDSREDTYWQSDGSQPHLVNIQFQKKVCHAPSSPEYHRVSQKLCWQKLNAY